MEVTITLNKWSAEDLIKMWTCKAEKEYFLKNSKIKEEEILTCIKNKDYRCIINRMLNYDDSLKYCNQCKSFVEKKYFVNNKCISCVIK